MIENQPELARCHDIEAKIAASLLMSHIIPADGKILDCETKRLCKLFVRRFGVNQTVADEFLSLTQLNQKPLVSVEELALAIKAKYSQKQLKSLIRDLWNIALSDNELHACEESLVYAVADFLGVSRRDLVSEQAKVCN